MLSRCDPAVAHQASNSWTYCKNGVAGQGPIANPEADVDALDALVTRVIKSIT